MTMTKFIPFFKIVYKDTGGSIHAESYFVWSISDNTQISIKCLNPIVEVKDEKSVDQYHRS